MDILGLIVFILIASAAVTALRRAGSPSRFHRAVRTRPSSGTGRRAAGTRPRKSWLVTAAKAAGVNLAGDHLGEATAELTGRTAGATVRAGRRRWLGLVGLAGRRWEARSEAGREPLILTRTKPEDEDGAEGPASPGDPDPAPAGSNPASGTGPPAAAGSASSGPSTSDPPEAGTSPAPARTPIPASAPPGAERNRKPMNRYAINLEHPTTDGEFLESCIQLGDVLKSLADQIGDWADGLSSLNLPASVLSPLHQVSEGITDAADGAAKAAAAFENEFEDARDVAARGMHFTGQDAA